MLEYLCLYQHTESCPILLHCRDPPGTNQALLDTLTILKQHVSHTTRIYLHCYRYSWKEFSHWNMTFPNLFICFTPQVLSPKDCHPNMTRFIKGLEPNRYYWRLMPPILVCTAKVTQRGHPPKYLLWLSRWPSGAIPLQVLSFGTAVWPPTSSTDCE